MDSLAEDTLHYEIMPYLSYEERINFNMALKPQHRHTKKFKDKDASLNHEFHVAVEQIRIALDNIQSSLNFKQRCDSILKIVKLLKHPRYSIVMTYSADFREKTLKKNV